MGSKKISIGIYFFVLSHIGVWFFSHWRMILLPQSPVFISEPLPADLDTAAKVLTSSMGRYRDQPDGPRTPQIVGRGAPHDDAR
jgi:hypothetical protein